MTTFRNPDGVHSPFGFYSHTASVPAGSELVFMAGQVGVRPDGSTPATLAEQADQALANIVALLAAHGLVASDIVKLGIFIVAGQDALDTRAARAQHLGQHRPASTLLYVSQLADPMWLIEIEAVAARSAAPQPVNPLPA